MPNDKQVITDPDEETERRALAEARADLAAGRVVAHVEVVKWLESWGTAERKPRPEASG